MAVNPDAQPIVEEDLATMASLLELPENSIVVDGVVVVQYIDGDGDSHVMFKTSDSYDSHLIGMLYMAAWQILNIKMNHGDS